MLLDCPKCGRDCSKEVSSGIAACPSCFTSLRETERQTDIYEVSDFVASADCGNACDLNDCKSSSVSEGYEICRVAYRHNPRLARVFMIASVISICVIALSVGITMIALNLTSGLSYQIELSGDSVLNAPMEGVFTEYCDRYDSSIFVEMLKDIEFLTGRCTQEFIESVNSSIEVCDGDLDKLVDLLGGVSEWDELYSQYLDKK